ncbi:putative 2-dehydropantoate 2-reductase [Chamaesiphon minutus]|uniref:2-dehydropantoate 2-reductase n=1 Tax=Chamaesiphon minutus (strain ATCC 27169 / PCC 6605) TaxID=1173020 RepID=K9UNQ7_CHAP6|nr:putative 2-dehydropantoate 2-reductase [Chamaesiphon minutus]AFY96081.1 2-dehydropantoate 2-reductase [Chamaesiphon minutus PCC 6605]
MKTYAIVGTGALGGFYGAKLQRAGLDVHFLLNSDYQHVKQSGLVIESIDGDFTLPSVNAYDRACRMPACDVIVICLKTTHNRLLPDILPNLVKSDSVILVLQNGLGTEAAIAKILPDRAIVGGLCFICSNKVAPGRIHHLDYGEIKLGAYADGYQATPITQMMAEIATDFRNAGVAISLCADLLLVRWQKLVWNIPYNGLSVVLNATTDRLMADPHTSVLVAQLMHEVKLAASACDRDISEEFIEQMLAYTLKMKPYRTSMKIDYDSGRPLEIAAMFGTPLQFAHDRGVELPLVGMLYQQLQFLNAAALPAKNYLPGDEIY